jgi:cytidyltransferase-like protein
MKLHIDKFGKKRIQGEILPEEKSIGIIIQILENSKLEWWLDFGQLLSLWRSSNPLTWSDDWDFCIVKNNPGDYQKVLNEVKKISNQIFERGEHYIRFVYLNFEIDFYFFEIDSENKIMKALNWRGYDMKLFFYQNLQIINWRSLRFKAPRHLDIYLKIRYGDDWKTPIQRSYAFDKSNAQKYKSKVSCLIPGIFDGLHEGHQNLISQSLKYFDEVKIGITRDELVTYKEKPKFNYQIRLSNLKQKYPNIQIIEDCPLVTGKDFLNSVDCDFVVFGEEISPNLKTFYPDDEVNHAIDRYPIISSRKIRNNPISSFCINLFDKEIKYIRVLEQMEKLKIYPRRFVVERWNIDKPILREGVGEKSNQILESHLSLLKHLSKLEDEFFLILEDDVMVILQVDIQDLIMKAPSDWDVIYLGGLNHYRSPDPINEIFNRCNFSFNLHSMIIKKIFIPTLIRELEKKEYESDVIFAHLQSNRIGNWYSVNQDIIIQNGKESPTFITSFPQSYNSIKNISKGIRLSKIKSDKKFNKIFQIGFNKCGTTSLHEFLIKNGLYSIHWDDGNLARKIIENFNRKRPLLSGYEEYDAFLDMESVDDDIHIYLTHFKMLDSQYPNSKFILNIRNVDDWILSRLNHPNYLRITQISTGLKKEGVIDFWKNSFQKHLLEVKNYFKERESDFLILDIDGDKNELFQFLSKFMSLTNTNFGHENITFISNSETERRFEDLIYKNKN